jgi:hypothetical protein
MWCFPVLTLRLWRSTLVITNLIRRHTNYTYAVLRHYEVRKLYRNCEVQCKTCTEQDTLMLGEVNCTNCMEQSPSWEANRSSASQEIPSFYGTRRFITAFTRARHLPLAWTISIQSMPPHPTWSILILSSHLRLGLPSGLLPSGLPTKILYAPHPSPIRATCPAHLILLDLITRIFGDQYRSLSSSLCSLLHSPVTPSLSGTNIPLSTLFRSVQIIKFLVM